MFLLTPCPIWFQNMVWKKKFTKSNDTITFAKISQGRWISVRNLELEQAIFC